MSSARLGYAELGNWKMEDRVRIEDEEVSTYNFHHLSYSPDLFFNE